MKLSTFVFNVLLLGILSDELWAGKTYSRSRLTLSPQSLAVPVNPHNIYREDEIFFEAAQLELARESILKTRHDSREQIKLLALAYEKSAHFFESSDDYINLLSCPIPQDKALRQVCMKAADAFMAKHVQQFMQTNPSISNINNMADNITYSIDLSIELKTAAMPLV